MTNSISTAASSPRHDIFAISNQQVRTKKLLDDVNSNSDESNEQSSSERLRPQELRNQQRTAFGNQLIREFQNQANSFSYENKVGGNSVATPEPQLLSASNLSSTSRGQFDRCTPIDIDNLLNEVTSYKDELAQFLKTNIFPGNYIKQQGGERFVDLVLVAENARAKKMCQFSDAKQAPFLHYMDDLRDLLSDLSRKKKNDHFSRQSGLVRINQKRKEKNIEIERVSHTVYYVAKKEADTNRIILGIVDSCRKDVAGKMLQEIEMLKPYYSLDANVALATDIQKVFAGCPNFATNIAIKNERDPAAIDKVLAAGLAGDLRGVVEDYEGNFVPWKTYLHTNSDSRMDVVTKNFLNIEENLNDASIPGHKNTHETLSEYRKRHRVQQEIYNPPTDTGQLRWINNSNDVKRIKHLNRVIQHIEELKETHGGNAGSILANELATVRPCREHDWAKHLPLSSKIYPNFLPKNGLGHLDRNPETWESLGDKAIPVLMELLEAVPKWHSPSLCVQALNLVIEGVKYLTEKKERGLFDILSKAFQLKEDMGTTELMNQNKEAMEKLAEISAIGNPVRVQPELRTRAGIS